MAPLPDSLLALLPRSFLPRADITTASDISSSGLSPLQVYKLQKRAASFEHGAGARPATDFNNQGFFALFAILGAAMVLASIWFFFWAKNGGFRFKETDWDDYKSTVLRRKGPDGRTLSNATRSTKLGGGSVVHGGSYTTDDTTTSGYTEVTGYTDKDEMREVQPGHGIRGGHGRPQRDATSNNCGRDPELREYRQEKAARVGGINRQHDGNYFDYSTTEPSDVSRAPLMGAKEEKKERARLEKEKKQTDKANAKKAKDDAKAAQKAEAARKKEEKKKNKSRSPSSGPTRPAAVVLAEPATTQHRPSGNVSYSHLAADETQTVYSGAYTVPGAFTHSYPDIHESASQPSQASYYDTYRPQTTRSSAPSQSQGNSARRPRVVQPSGEWQSQPADSEVGTKSYPCYIPGLSSAGSVRASDSVSQAGGNRTERKRREGYRRGRGRRDSLSDSE